MGSRLFSSALEQLQEQFLELDWTFHDVPNLRNEKMYHWPGVPDEDILICVHKSNGKQELFHRHDFFYFNYTYKGCYDSLSQKFDNQITIREKELYAGQPFAGHALCVHDNQETIIIGVVIRKETFFRSFLPMLSANSKLFHFFLAPATNTFSDEFIHFEIKDESDILSLLEMMVIEYADKKPDTQDILKPLVLTFLMQIARQYALTNPAPKPEKLSERIVQHIGENVDTVTLNMISKRFSYHPNYISTLLHREIGKSFSEILLEQRMERAVILLKSTTLPINEIALMLGYSNSSNFYKAFRQYYHMSPREYVSDIASGINRSKRI